MAPGSALGIAKEGIKRLLPRSVVVRRLGGGAGRAILLTFDDGPDPAVTPAVLDRLDAYGAKAVFFVIGRRVGKAPGLVREILARGHRIGNHSYLHRRSYVRPGRPQVGIGAYYRDLLRCQERIEATAGIRPDLFRPPGGRLVPKTLLTSRLLGLRCVTWSQDVRDWSFRDAGQGRGGGEWLIDRARPGDIVLLHDNNPPVLDLLDVLLPGLRSKGFDLASGLNRL